MTISAFFSLLVLFAGHAVGHASGGDPSCYPVESLFGPDSRYHQHHVDAEFDQILYRKEKQLEKFLELEFSTPKSHWASSLTTKVMSQKVKDRWAHKEVRPFVLSHGKKTDYTILMAHGLTDSPYYLQHYARFFFEQGYNVVGILLSGHGWHPAALSYPEIASVSEWKKDLEEGYHLSRLLGNKVIGFGYSTGGTLVLNAATPRPRKSCRRPKPPVPDLHFAGLILVAPALGLVDDVAQTLSANMIFGISLFKKYAREHRADDVNWPFRYHKLATNGLAQLKYMIEEIEENEKENEMPMVYPPSVAILTEQDDVVSNRHVLNFFSQHILDKNGEVFVLDRQEPPSHGGLIRFSESRNQNPKWFLRENQKEAITRRLIQFISTLPEGRAAQPY